MFSEVRMKSLFRALGTVLVLGSFAPSAVIAATIAHWRFEEGPSSSLILDSSGNGLHGTAIGGTSYVSDTPYPIVPGTIDPNTYALGLDGGTDTRVLIPDDELFELAGSFTLEASINLAALPAAGFQWQILFRGDSRGGLDPFYLDVWDGSVRFTINDEIGGGATVSTIAPDLNTWVNVAGIYDANLGTMSLYVDGQLVDSKATTIQPFTQLDAKLNPGVSIGGYPDNHYGPFYGLIDEVRISDVALSPTQLLVPGVVPEPSSLLVLGIGLVGIVFQRARDRSRRHSS